MKFEGNKYNGERNRSSRFLRDKQKFTEDVESDTFRKKVEQRIFTTNVMLWSEVKKRAAMNPQWQWHRRDALDKLKDDLVSQGIWREDGGYIDRSPPPPKTTTVQIQERYARRRHRPSRAQGNARPRRHGLRRDRRRTRQPASKKVENGST